MIDFPYNSGIYKLTSPSGKCYIGQSVELKRRLNGYSSTTQRGFKALSEQPKLYNAIKKYGFDSFKVEILLWCDEANLDNAEKYFISHHDSIKNGYNCTTGGDGVRGYVRSEAQRKRHSECLMGRVTPDAVKEKMSKTHKELWDNNPEKKEAYSQMLKGRTYSDETLSKMSDAAKNMTAAHRKNLSIAQTGKKASLASREKMRASRLRFIERQKQNG